MQTIYVVLAALAGTAAAQKECYDGPLKMGSDTVAKGEIVQKASALFLDGAGKAIANSTGFKEFMQSRGLCQIDSCMVKMVSVAVSTVYGKCGQTFMGDDCGALVVESLTGAFMACFPGAPRAPVHSTVGYIVEHFGQGSPKDNSDLFAENRLCPNSASEFPMDDFMDAFGKAVSGVGKQHPKLMTFFQKDALDCQLTCVETTISLAAGTLHTWSWKVVSMSKFVLLGQIPTKNTQIDKMHVDSFQGRHFCGTNKNLAGTLHNIAQGL
jgi:hypothetical protein